MRFRTSLFLFLSFFASPGKAAEVVWDYHDIPICEDFICFLSEPGYSADGYTITGTSKETGDEHVFGYRGTASVDAYYGQSLLHSTQYIDEIRKDDGQPFDVLSISMRGGVASSDGFPDINLIFTAEYSDGSKVVTYKKKNVSYAVLETFTDPSWVNLVSLSVDDDGYYSGYQSMGMEFHEIGFSTSSDPTGYSGDTYVSEWQLQDSIQNGRQFYDIWGSSAQNVFAVGLNGLFHYNGADWTALPLSTNIIAGIWGSSAADIFTVGYDGTILHYDGTEWTLMDSGTDISLYDIWGTSASNVFVVGNNGTMLHYDGTSWSPMDSGTDNSLSGIWGRSGSDVYAVGSSGTVLHYDGSTWTPMVSGTGRFLSDVWGCDSSVLAVGESGTIIEYDGTLWRDLSDASGIDLNGIWGSSQSNIVVVGDVGTILRYDGTDFMIMRNEALGNLYGVWGESDTEVFAAGTNGTVAHNNGESLVEVYPGQTLNVSIGSAVAQSYTAAELQTLYKLPPSYSPLSYVRNFTADIGLPGAKTAFRFKAKDLQGSISGLSLFKLRKNGTSRSFSSYARSPEFNRDGAWWISDAQGNFLNSSETLDSRELYYVNFVVEDNGEYDLDDTPVVIEDPLVLGSMDTVSGGCFISVAAKSFKVDLLAGIVREFLGDRFRVK